MSDQIDCPHCAGSGKVSESFLTDDHVATVFADYCEIFGIHLAYGVESYSEVSNGVSVKQDRSCRGCYNNEYHTLPGSYFTRDREKRLALMRADFDAKQKADAAEKKREQKRKLAELERDAARLRDEILP